ncbi:hypothetical protein F5Y16DRAFT_416190 [Xylariaceae sp. FL0255]|nr:hypothetical protein F5Y16DRAFT_416190 [Xylariaceae sp. FL0255]
MTDMIPQVQRRGGPRSKSGCETKHVKCNEGRPHCRRCLETGGICQYPVDAATQQGVLALSRYAIPFRIPGSQQDRQLLHYFCVQGSSELTGFLDSDFWSRLVMQRSHDHNVVRQATLALSYAHRCISTTDSSSPDYEPLPAESIVRYNKAMRALRKHLSHNIDMKRASSFVVPLICAILFFCFESTQGNIEAAVQHLDFGLKILSQRPKETSCDPENKDLTTLRRILARLDLQASIFLLDKGRLPKYVTTCDLKRPYQGPSQFRTIQDAQDELTIILHRQITFLILHKELEFTPGPDLPPKVVAEKRMILELYTRWEAKLDQFEQKYKAREHEGLHDFSGHTETETLHDAAYVRSKAPPKSTQPASSVLRMHCHLFRLLFKASLPLDESIFTMPEYQSRKIFENLLDLAESTLTGRVGTSVTKSVAAETGIVAPLFLISTKCRDTDISYRAFNLLATCGRREGLFDAQVATQLVVRTSPPDSASPL